VVTPEVLQNVLRLALAGNGDQVQAVVRDLLRHDLPEAQILSALLVPALREVGDLWHANLIDVDAQQRVSAVFEYVLGDLWRTQDSARDRDVVVIAAPLGERHTFCAQVAAMCLDAEGWEVVDLGGDVGATDLSSALDFASASAQRVAAVVVHTARSALLPSALDLVEVARDRGVGVASGGRGFGQQGRWSGRLGIGSWAPTVRGICDVLATASPVPGESVVTTASREAASQVAARRDDLVVSCDPWTTALTAHAVGDIAPAAFFADALASSVQFAEVEIMVDAAEWYRGFLVSRDSPVQPAREVLDVIANAFADVPHCNEPVAHALATLG
jgi:methanogenic corrinoid protein MtbC1